VVGRPSTLIGGTILFHQHEFLFARKLDLLVVPASSSLKTQLLPASLLFGTVPDCTEAHEWSYLRVSHYYSGLPIESPPPKLLLKNRSTVILE
jgi:hypothetical protein